MATNSLSISLVDRDNSFRWLSFFGLFRLLESCQDHNGRRRAAYLDGGHEGHGHLLVEDVVPVDILEEGVGLDVLRVAGAAAETLLGVALQQLNQTKEGRGFPDVRSTSITPKGH